MVGKIKKTYKITFKIPEELLKLEKFSDFRDDLFKFTDKWNLETKISKGIRTVIKVIFK